MLDCEPWEGRAGLCHQWVPAPPSLGKAQGRGSRNACRLSECVWIPIIESLLFLYLAVSIHSLANLYEATTIHRALLNELSQAPET